MDLFKYKLQNIGSGGKWISDILTWNLETVKIIYFCLYGELMALHKENIDHYFHVYFFYGW